MQERNDDHFAKNEPGQSSNDAAHSMPLPDLLQRFVQDRAKNDTNPQPQISDLVDALKQPEWYVRAQAIYQLGELDGPPSLEPLVAALNDADPSVRAAAIHVIGTSGRPDALANIVSALHDSDWHVREIAAQTLGRFDDATARNALEKALHDSDAMVRQAAEYALASGRQISSRQTGKQVSRQTRRQTQGLSLHAGAREASSHEPVLRADSSGEPELASSLPACRDEARFRLRPLRSLLSPRHRRWVIAAIAASLIIVLLAPNTRVLAYQLLTSVRVLYFQIVQEHTQVAPSHAFPNLQDLGELRVAGFETEKNLSASQAARLVNFPLRLPTTLPEGMHATPIFAVTEGGQTTFTFRTRMAQAYLARNGYTGVHIPPHLDGATFTISVAANVTIIYRDHAHAFQITETPTPIITASNAAAIDDLQSFLLSLSSNMPEPLVKQMAHIALSSGTVPIVVDAQTSVQQASINGTEGISLAGTTGHAPFRQLIWQTSGIIYTITSQTEDTGHLLSTARSLQ